MDCSPSYENSIPELFPNQQQESSQLSGSKNEENSQKILCIFVEEKNIHLIPKLKNLFQNRKVKSTNVNEFHSTNRISPAKRTNFKNESGTEKSPNTSGGRKRRDIDEGKAPDNSKDQSCILPPKQNRISNPRQDNFHIRERINSNHKRLLSPPLINEQMAAKDNTQCVRYTKQRSADAVRELHNVNLINTESTPSCSKASSCQEPSRNCSKVVASNNRKLSLCAFSNPSSSLELQGKPSTSLNMVNPVSLSTSKKSASAIASLSGKEEGSENYSNDSNSLAFFGKNYPMKKKKIEEMQSLQNKRLVEFDKLIEMVLNNNYLRNMLGSEKRRKILDFKDIISDQKYLLLRFYSLSNSWYDIYTFCSEVHFDAEPKKIFEVFKKFHNKGLVEFVDYQNHKCDLKKLLEPLSTDQLKKLTIQLCLKEKSSKKFMKSNLKTLIAEKFSSTNDLKVLAMKAIKKVLGCAARLSESMYDAFNYIYILTTFANPELSDINNYFKHVIDENGVFPKASIEKKYAIFRTADEFRKYVAAVQMQKQLDCEGNIIEINMLADKAYHKLLADQQDAERNLPHIHQFTSNQVYCSILSKCCESLFKNDNCGNDNLLLWLNYLSHNFYENRQIGTWSCQIIEILKKKGHIEKIADTLINVFSERIKPFLKEKDVFELGKLGRLMAQKFRHLGDVSKHDRIIELIPRNIDISLFKRCDINMSEKRNKCPIREATLLHYSREGYQNMENMGQVLKALLVLYFWDIIYDPKVFVPATFISELQFAPTDMYIFDTLHHRSWFYGERKEAIDQRIEEIKKSWTQRYLMEFGKDNYQCHSQEFSAAGVIMNIIDKVDTIQVLVSVIGRTILAKIFERLITDLEQYDEGMPEFLIWNNDGTPPKFVVNTTSDSLAKLPIATSLWLEYLARNKAQVEVCIIHAADIKNKIKIQSSRVTENDSI